jgi:hypothetical protein
LTQCLVWNELCKWSQDLCTHVLLSLLSIHSGAFLYTCGSACDPWYVHHAVREMVCTC